MDKCRRGGGRHETATWPQAVSGTLHLLPDLHTELGPEDPVRSVPLAAPATDQGVCLRSDPMAVWPTAFPSAANPLPRCGLAAGTQDSFHQNEHLQLRPIPRTASSCERRGGSSDRAQGPSQIPRQLWKQAARLVPGTAHISSLLLATLASGRCALGQPRLPAHLCSPPSLPWGHWTSPGTAFFLVVPTGLLTSPRSRFPEDVYLWASLPPPQN